MRAWELGNTWNVPVVVVSVVIWCENSGCFEFTDIWVKEVRDAVVITIVKANTVSIGIKLERIRNSIAIAIGILLVWNAVTVRIGHTATCASNTAFIHVGDAVTIFIGRDHNCGICCDVAVGI